MIFSHFGGSFRFLQLKFKFPLSTSSTQSTQMHNLSGGNTQKITNCLRSTTPHQKCNKQVTFSLACNRVTHTMNSIGKTILLIALVAAIDAEEAVERNRVEKSTALDRGCGKTEENAAKTTRSVDVGGPRQKQVMGGHPLPTKRNGAAKKTAKDKNSGISTSQGPRESNWRPSSPGEFFN